MVPAKGQPVIRDPDVPGGFPLSGKYSKPSIGAPIGIEPELSIILAPGPEIHVVHDPVVPIVDHRFIPGHIDAPYIGILVVVCQFQAPDGSLVRIKSIRQGHMDIGPFKSTPEHMASFIRGQDGIDFRRYPGIRIHRHHDKGNFHRSFKIQIHNPGDQLLRMENVPLPVVQDIPGPAEEEFPAVGGGTVIPFLGFLPCFQPVLIGTGDSVLPQGHQAGPQGSPPEQHRQPFVRTGVVYMMEEKPHRPLHRIPVHDPDFSHHFRAVGKNQFGTAMGNGPFYFLIGRHPILPGQILDRSLGSQGKQQGQSGTEPTP